MQHQTNSWQWKLLNVCAKLFQRVILKYPEVIIDMHGTNEITEILSMFGTFYTEMLSEFF
jgi:hypothetical protein